MGVELVRVKTLFVVTTSFTPSDTSSTSSYVAPTSCRLMVWPSVFVLVPDMVTVPDVVPGALFSSLMRAHKMPSPILSMYHFMLMVEESGSEMFAEKFIVEPRLTVVVVEEGLVIVAAGGVFVDVGVGVGIVVSL